MTAAKGAPGRAKPKRQVLAALRLAVYDKCNWKCVDCDWKPGVPEDYDGRYALFEMRPHRSTRKNPSSQVTVYLELGHIIPPDQGGLYELGNLNAQCSPCNRRRPPAEGGTI
jgi:5-methylcytosine-specific restriction endonuclease McrA